jgi:hypothetical protein
LLAILAMGLSSRHAISTFMAFFTHASRHRLAEAQMRACNGHRNQGCNRGKNSVLPDYASGQLTMIGAAA